jgi:hypothetical protein
MPLKIVSAVLMAAAILIGMPRAAEALDPKWPPGPYKYVVIEQELKDALIEFGRNVNVPVKVSDEVKGKLRGDLGAGSAEDFFKRLTSSHGLVWYFDGSVLHVNSASELRTEVIDLGRILPTDVVSKLTSSASPIRATRFGPRRDRASFRYRARRPISCSCARRSSQWLGIYLRARIPGCGYSAARAADNAAFRCFDNSAAAAPDTLRSFPLNGLLAGCECAG